MIPKGIITAYNPTGVKNAIKKNVTEKIIHSGLILSLSIENKESQPNNSFNYDLPLIRLLRATEVFADRNLKKVLLDCIAMRCYLSPQCNLIRPLGCRFSALCSTGKIQYYAESSIRCTQKKAARIISYGFL